MEQINNNELSYIELNAILNIEAAVVEKYVYAHEQLDAMLFTHLCNFATHLIDSFRSIDDRYKEKVCNGFNFETKIISTTLRYHFLEMLMEKKIFIDGEIKRDKSIDVFSEFELNINRKPSNRVLINLDRRNFTRIEHLMVNGIREPISFERFVYESISNLSNTELHDRFNRTIDFNNKTLIDLLGKTKEHYDWLTLERERIIKGPNYTTYLKVVVSDDKRKELKLLRDVKNVKIQIALKNDERLKKTSGLLEELFTNNNKDSYSVPLSFAHA